ncbi:CoA-binding protein [Exiguobacterium sp. BRG2]|uniref:CoA-binding protein n=1 Tax=unclassified Exiguobacterium TaxID=2644629 RepID=UPI0028817797|nr:MULTISPECIES: CoA-binding protein [unclassified Exiguobacterium]MDT0172970.1 CoA-binding protein [Exiguobacterium sp. BRG2]
MITDQEARQYLKDAKRIAVVGVSSDSGKTANWIADYLVQNGYEVIPVNPTLNEWNGQKVYPSVASIPGHIDIVDVFRRSEFLADVAKDAVAHGDVGMIWNQLGLSSVEAESLALGAGIPYIENRCIKIEHQYL